MNLSKERPICRKRIEKYLNENPNKSLDDIVKHSLYFTDGMRTQARRMIQEKAHPGIFIKGKSFFLDTGSYNYKYQILFSDANTLPKIIRWIRHLSKKNWVTPLMIRSFIEVTATKSGVHHNDGKEKTNTRLSSVEGTCRL